MRVGAWWSAESLLRGQGRLIGRRPPSPLPRVASACIRKNGPFRPTPAMEKLPAPPKTGRDSAHATPTPSNFYRRFHADEFLHTTGRSSANWRKSAASGICARSSGDSGRIGPGCYRMSFSPSTLSLPRRQSERLKRLFVGFRADPSKPRFLWAEWTRQTGPAARRRRWREPLGCAICGNTADGPVSRAQFRPRSSGTHALTSTIALHRPIHKTSRA